MLTLRVLNTTDACMANPIRCQTWLLLPIRQGDFMQLMPHHPPGTTTQIATCRLHSNPPPIRKAQWYRSQLKFFLTHGTGEMQREKNKDSVFLPVIVRSLHEKS